jgi:hypothetical protein
MFHEAKSHDSLSRGAWSLLLAMIASSLAACLDSKNDTSVGPSFAGMGGEGHAGADQGGAGGNPADAGGGSQWTAGAGGESLVEGVCVGGPVENSCGTSCPSLSEAREIRGTTAPITDVPTTYLERTCQGPDGSPRVVIHIDYIFYSMTYVFDPEGKLVGVVHHNFETGACNSPTTATTHYGEMGGDCSVRRGVDCPDSDAGIPPGSVFVCVSEGDDAGE